MVRTKKHFRPPSSSSSSESSDGDDDDYNIQAAMASQRGRGKQLGNFGGGKQLSMGRPGGGKQLSMAPPDDDSSDDDDDDDEEEQVPASGGKMMRPMGRGKQLRAPSPQRDDDDDDDSDSSDESVPHVPVGSGKRLGAMSGGGKQLRRQSANVEEDDDSSDDSDDDAPWEVAAANRGQGKMLRPSSEKKKEESDMDESSEEEEEEDEEEVKKQPVAATAPKHKEPEFDDSDESEPAPAPKRRGRPPRAAATRASARAKAAKKVMSSDSDSDSSSEEELELDFETFDTQKLVQNDDDKKYLDSLPELEREAILAERFDELKKQADIKKALRENKRRDREAKKAAEGGQKKKAPVKKKAAATKSKKAPPKKKQKVAEEKEEEDSSEDDEAIDTSADAALAASLSGKRVSARNLVKKGKQFKKQAALAKIRESRANKKVDEESDSDLDYGRDSDDSDDDYEETMKPWQMKGKKKAATQLQAAESSDESMVEVEEEDKDEPVKRTEDVEAEQEDYAKVCIPRRRLIRWCNEPYFLNAIKNCYVRIGIGRDNKTQKACYRLCKIDGIVTKDAYTFPVSEGQNPVTTDKWLTVSFGNKKREFKMLTVSDHRPTVDDVAKYVGHLKNERTHTLLSKKKANKLRKKQDELVTNYTYTKEDIEMLVKEKKKRNKKSANIGLEKTRMAIAVRAAEDAVKELEKQLDDAEVKRMEADGEAAEMVADEEVANLKQALEEATQNLMDVKAEQNRILKEDEERINKLKQNAKVQNWDKVNQRARLANQNADFAAYKEQRAREQAEGSAEPKFDPYARRKVKPKNLWEVKGAKTDEGAEATVEEEKKECGTLVERDDSNATKEVDKENKRDDIPDTQKHEVPTQSNQFAYDDDIMIGGDIANLAGIGVKKTTTRTRKGISLEDYQSRKAAGTL